MGIKVIIEMVLLAVGLAMDAFAISVCKGLAVKKISPKQGVIAGLWFGGSQMVMPIIGYFLGSRFQKYIEKADHWIAFVLLAVIGINMIREALSKETEESDASFAFKKMFPLAVATSIDALVVGIALAMDNTKPMYVAAPLIGGITFALAFIGIYIGNIFGTKYKAKAEFIGGVILILMGMNILFEHLGIL